MASCSAAFFRRNLFLFDAARQRMRDPMQWGLRDWQGPVAAHDRPKQPCSQISTGPTMSSTAVQAHITEEDAVSKKPKGR